MFGMQDNFFSIWEEEKRWMLERKENTYIFLNRLDLAFIISMKAREERDPKVVLIFVSVGLAHN